MNLRSSLRWKCLNTRLLGLFKVEIEKKVKRLMKLGHCENGTEKDWEWGLGHINCNYTEWWAGLRDRVIKTGSYSLLFICYLIFAFGNKICKVCDQVEQMLNLFWFPSQIRVARTVGILNQRPCLHPIAGRMNWVTLQWSNRLHLHLYLYLHLHY